MSPRTRRPAMLAALTLLTGMALPATAGIAAVATPSETGCPVGFQTLSVSWLTSQGSYRLPGILDAAGNNDGLVCGKPFNDAAATGICGGPCAVPVLYLFRDNTITPAH